MTLKIYKISELGAETQYKALGNIRLDNESYDKVDAVLNGAIKNFSIGMESAFGIELKVNNFEIIRKRNLISYFFFTVNSKNIRNLRLFVDTVLLPPNAHQFSMRDFDNFVKYGDFYSYEDEQSNSKFVAENRERIQLCLGWPKTNQAKKDGVDVNYFKGPITWWYSLQAKLYNHMMQSAYFRSLIEVTEEFCSREKLAFSEDGVLVSLN
jgi:hypothetical protein